MTDHTALSSTINGATRQALEAQIEINAMQFEINRLTRESITRHAALLALTAVTQLILAVAAIVYGITR